jgi:hypothetical protein
MKARNTIGVINSWYNSKLSVINMSQGGKASRLTTNQTKSRSKKESQIT